MIFAQKKRVDPPPQMCYSLDKGKPEKRPTLNNSDYPNGQPPLVQVVAAIFFPRRLCSIT